MKTGFRYNWLKLYSKFKFNTY